MESFHFFIISKPSDDAVEVVGFLSLAAWHEQMLFSDSDAPGSVSLFSLVSGNRNALKPVQDPEGGGMGRGPLVPPGGLLWRVRPSTPLVNKGLA